MAPAALRGKIIVVGTEALRLKDASTTSTTDGSLMSGPEIQANAIATVLAGLPLRSPAPIAGAALILLLAATAPLAAARLRPRTAVLVSAVAAAGLLVAAYALFAAGIVIPVVHPLIAWAIGVIGVLALTRAAPAPVPLPAAAVPEPAVPEPATAIETIGGCRLEGVIGRGGMGVVYRAEQPGLGRKVAVKVIAPQHAADARFRERFAREARLAAALDHPNIVPVYTTGDDGGQLYIVMRYVDGVERRGAPARGPAGARDRRRHRRPGRLGARRRPRARDRPPRRQARQHPARRALGRRAARLPHRLRDHPRGRRHRRVSPQPGAFIGSPDYAAPEQALGAGPLADLYSLGCVAYECLTGRPPQARDGAPPAPPSTLTPSLPAAVDEVVLRAIAWDPDRRWPTCAAFAERLAGALAVMG